MGCFQFEEELDSTCISFTNFYSKQYDKIFLRAEFNVSINIDMKNDRKYLFSYLLLILTELFAHQLEKSHRFFLSVHDSMPVSTIEICLQFCSPKYITKTYLYNFDPLKPHFYIVKLGFTGVYISFLISAQKHRLWVLAEAVLTSTHNPCFEQKYEKYLKIFIFFFWWQNF